MNYTDDAYAVMLLCIALSPDREEYARPLSVREFKELESAVRRSRYGRLGSLLGADISGLMMYLDLSEAQALRIFTLLQRSVQLTYALERLRREGIDVVTCLDDQYPQRLSRRLGDQAPALYYRCGDGALTNQPAIALVGIGGIRTDDRARQLVNHLVAQAVRRGYVVVTGGEPGISHVAGLAADGCGGRLVDVLGGDMLKYVHGDGVAERIALGRCAVLSLCHPQALFTVVHAASRNRLLFALVDAAFIFNTDNRRGEAGILQGRVCPNVYAWEGYENNRSLIAHGAIPFGRGELPDFDDMAKRWQAGDARQMSLFEIL